jgi:cell division protein FtsQ
MSAMNLVAAPADKRFRRGRVKPVRKRGRWRGMARRAAKYGGLTLVAAYAAYVGAEVLPTVRVLEINRIVVRGNERLSPAEVIGVIGGIRGENMVATDLDAWRDRLLAWPWVQDATLRRRLPSTIEVVVSERRPIGIARLGDHLYLVDAHAVVIGVYGARHADLDLPILDGLLTEAESGVVAAADRVQLAARVMAAIAPRHELAQRLSQINLADAHNVAVILRDDSAVLYLGEERFLERLEWYVGLAATLRERVPDIEYVDLRFEGRIYVGPASGRRQAQRVAVTASDRGRTAGG